MRPQIRVAVTPFLPLLGGKPDPAQQPQVVVHRLHPLAQARPSIEERLVGDRDDALLRALAALDEQTRVGEYVDELRLLARHVRSTWCGASRDRAVVVDLDQLAEDRHERLLRRAREPVLKDVLRPRADGAAHAAELR